MATIRSDRLVLPVDGDRDHVLGGPEADLTLVEYGSYACEFCHEAHSMVASLRDRFGSRLRYVFRHLPLADRDLATRAAELAEYASQAESRFWEVHDALMKRSPRFDEGDLEQLAEELALPLHDERDEILHDAARARVRQDARSGLDSGARVTPTFFINGRRYEGPWDENSLAEALVGSLGHRLQSASLEFARWAPSTGLLLLACTLAALALSNSAVGPAFLAFWDTPFSIRLGEAGLSLSVFDWVNHGLLTVFFLVVGLEIKREVTVGRLASRRAATLPVVAAFGGMAMPALIYLAVAPSGPLSAGWGLVVATDTAFAVALIAFLGDRVPVELRVFLTAAAIVDDLVVIVIVAFAYTDALSFAALAAAGFCIVALVGLNRASIYRAMPYAILGIVLWYFLHESGVHATLAGVILAVAIPTRPPPNTKALMAQAQQVLRADWARRGEEVLRRGPSEPAMHALDLIHDRIESPASKVLRGISPWSSYFVLPIFALANAGLVWTPGILEGRGSLVAAIILGLVVGKPVGIVGASWAAARLGITEKPEAYSWSQLIGAGALAGIGFTMSLFIAEQAFPDAGDFTAAKVAIFVASGIAGAIGAIILLPRREGGAHG